MSIPINMDDPYISEARRKYREAVIRWQKNQLQENQNKIFEEQRKTADELNILEDDCELFGKYIICEMRSLSEDDRTIVKKIVCNAVLEAKLGNAKEISLNVNKPLKIV